MRRYNDFAIDLAVDKMAEIFNKKSTPVRTASVLLEAIEIIQQLRRNASPPPNPPLTLEELREMDGEPVYTRQLKKPSFFHDGWMLVTGYGALDRKQSLVFGDYGKTWLAYRRKRSEGTT